jgi:hypothetical protein
MSVKNDTPPVEYREVVGHPGYRVGSDGTYWTRWRHKRRKGWKDGFESQLSGEWKELRPHVDRKGYLSGRFTTRGKTISIRLHRVVLVAFVGPQPIGMECRHLDGDKRNNRLGNLCWGTREENAQDSIRHGTFSRRSRNRGANNGSARLNEGDVREIRRLRVGGVRVKEIAARFRIHVVHAYAILRGEHWKAV